MIVGNNFGVVNEVLICCLILLFQQPSPLPEYAYADTREGRRLRREMTGFGILMQSQKPK